MPNPQLTAIEPQSAHMIKVTFNTSVGDSALNPSNYQLSGTGQGSLPDYPDFVERVDDTNLYLIWISAGIDKTIESGSSVQLDAIVPGTGPYQYSWSPSDGLDDATIKNPIASPALGVNYTLTVAKEGFTEESGSSATDTVIVNVSLSNTFQTNVSDGQAPLTVLFDARNIVVSKEIVDYKWDFSDDQSSFVAQYGTYSEQQINTRIDYGRMVAHRFDQPGTYIVILTLTAEDGSSTTIQQTIVARAFSSNTYYVKTGGNDSLNGLSDATAWATISKVQNMMGIIRAGDKILFRRGDVFQGTLSLGSSFKGTRSYPITFGAYGEGNKPELQQLLVSSSGIIFINSVPNNSGIVLDNLYLHRTLWTSSPALYLYYYGGQVYSNLIIRNCDIEGGNDAITGIYGNSITIEDSIIHGASRQGIKTETGLPNVLIRNTYFHNNGTSTAFDHNIYLTNSINSLIEHSTFEAGTGGGITAHGVISNLMIRNNLIHNNDVGVSITAGYASAESFTDCLIENNRIYANTSMGIYMNCWVRGIVRNNLLYNNGDFNGQINLSSGASPDSLTTGTMIANNVLYGTGNGIQLNISASSDFIFKNNIIWTTSSSRYCVSTQNLNGTMLSNHNLYFAPSNANPFYLGGGSKSFAHWQASGYDTQSLNGNPLLTNPATGDFTLQATSACAGAGETLWQVYRDFIGIVRTRSDIGAYLLDQ